MSELGLSSSVDYSIKLKDENDIAHEMNPDRSFYKGNLSQGPGYSPYAFLDDLHRYINIAVNTNLWIRSSINNIPLLKENKELLIKGVVGNIDVHNYAIKLQGERTKTDDELYALFYNAVYYLIEIKRYNEGQRLIDYVTREDQERFIDKYARLCFLACKDYFASIELLPSDYITSDPYIDGIVNYTSDIPTDLIDGFDITYITGDENEDPIKLIIEEL